MQRVLVLVVILVAAAAGQHFQRSNVPTSDSCTRVARQLRSLETVPIKQLTGIWSTLSIASFGNTDLIDSSEYMVYVRSSSTLHPVADCTRHRIREESRMRLNIFSEYFFETASQNTYGNASYFVQGGKWFVMNTTQPQELAVSFVVLSASPNSHLVLATCRDVHDEDGVQNFEPVNTVIHVLGRRNHSLSSDDQLRTLIRHAQSLGRQEFLAAQLSDTCLDAKMPSSSSTTLVFDQNALFSLLFVLLAHIR